MGLRRTHCIKYRPFVTPANAGVHFDPEPLGFPLSRE